MRDVCDKQQQTLEKRKTVYKNKNKKKKKKIVPAGSAIISEYANEIAGPKKQF